RKFFPETKPIRNYYISCISFDHASVNSTEGRAWEAAKIETMTRLLSLLKNQNSLRFLNLPNTELVPDREAGLACRNPEQAGVKPDSYRGDTIDHYIQGTAVLYRKQQIKLTIVNGARLRRAQANETTTVPRDIPLDLEEKLSEWQNEFYVKDEKDNTNVPVCAD